MSGKENGDNCVVEDSVGSVVGSLLEIIVKSSYSFESSQTRSQLTLLFHLIVAAKS